MLCLYAASEVAGFAKTGGLADVAASLPIALAKNGVDIAVIMPLYRGVRQRTSPVKTGLTLHIPVGDHVFAGSIWKGQLPGANVAIYFIDQPDFFDRDDPALGRGIYQAVDDSGRIADYRDNAARFIFFSRAILESCWQLQLWPDILHLNDWQTALAAVYLRELYQSDRTDPVRARYQNMHTALTIHNLAYQGVFWKHDMPLTGLPWRLFNSHQLEFYDHINFLKGGIVYADVVNTVSPSYAREIQTPYFGQGLQGVLRTRGDGIIGIVNGADYSVWNPAGDTKIAANYDVTTVAEGKARCKTALQQRCGLVQDPGTAVLGLVSRLAEQKGIDLVIAIAPLLVDLGAQLVLLGVGDSHYHRELASLQTRFPQRISTTLVIDETLAHQIEAGADMFLMPSRYEPCGLNQLYSLKYGTVPIVRATGGLADTVVDASPENVAAGTATGFSFRAMSPAGLFEACQRALRMFREQPEQWRDLQRTGMTQDWSWRRSAEEYLAMYRQCLQTR